MNESVRRSAEVVLVENACEHLVLTDEDDRFFESLFLAPQSSGDLKRVSSS